jgi:O-antigen/teichoic acid export membrane protein
MISRLRRNDLAYHGAIVFSGLIVANVFNYLYYMVASRVMGVEPYGELTSLNAAVFALAAPASVAQIVVARLAAEFDATSNRSALNALTRMTVLWAGALGALAVVVVVLVRQPLAGFFHLPSAQPVVVSALTLAAFAFATVGRGIFQGSHRFGEMSVSYLVEGGVRFAIGIPLTIQHGAIGALAGFAIGELACLGYNLWAFRGALGATGAAFHLEAGYIARLASRVGIAQLVLTVLSAQYDVALVRHFFDANAAGLYAAAALIGRAVLGVLAFIPTLVMPKATALAARGAAGSPLLVTALGVSAAIIAPAAFLAAIAPAGVVALFAGKAFREAGPLVSTYVAAAGALGLANVVAAYQIGLHRYAFVWPAATVGLAEVLTIAFWHPSLIAVIWTLFFGHATLLAATFIGVGSKQNARSFSEGF